MSSIFYSKRLRYLDREYLFQTTYNEADREVVGSLFNEGRILDMRHTPLPQAVAHDGIIEYVIKIHEAALAGYELLLKAAEARKNSGRVEEGIKLSSALMTRRLYDEAIEFLESISRKTADDSAVCLLKGKLYLAKDMPERAELEFRKAADLSPDYPDIRNLLGETYLRLKKPTAAIDQFKKAVELNVYYDRAFYNLGLGYILNGIVREDFDLTKDIQRLCRETFEKATLLNPGYAGEELKAGLNRLGEGNLEAAYEQLSRISGERKSDSQFERILEMYIRCVFGNRGVTEENVKTYIDSLESLLTTNPGYADLENELGMAYTLMGKIMGDNAMDHFRMALAINPDFKKALKNLKLSENELRGFDVLLEAILK
jgi:tetratricopeptide (TPR) repeat protein